MTLRTVMTGKNPLVTIRAGVNIQVQGWAEERVTAESGGMGGLKIERKGEEIEVKIGGSGKVSVPFGSTLKVYAGKDTDVTDIQGEVTLIAGSRLSAARVARLVHATAGGAMDIDCQDVVGNDVKLSAGRDLRCFIRGLNSARLRVNDLGGYWEGRIADGQVTLTLKAGGDVTVVTDQEVQPQPPDFVLGMIVSPD